MTNLQEQFKPGIFWFWNGKLTKSLISNQLKEMKQKGIGSVFIHAMPSDFRPETFPDGLTCKYLSGTWFKWIVFALEQAKLLSMKIWLYDEGGWPSGLANGQILNENPEYKAKVLIQNKGTYKIKHIDNRTDLLNENIVSEFIKSTYQRYKNHVGHEFGKAIPGIFTDEPYVPGCIGTREIPWTTGIAKDFLKVKGYDLNSILHLLFPIVINKNNKSQIFKARKDFFDVWTSLFEKKYFKKIHTWCENNKLLFTGHLGGEECLSSHYKNFGHFFKYMRHFDIPGIDSIIRHIHPETKETYFPKFASSAAWHYNRKYALSESFAVAGWGNDFIQMKWVTDIQYSQGINMVVPMACHSSNNKSRMISTCSNVFSPDPRWKFYSAYAEYCSNVAKIFSDFRPEICSTIYYPIHNYLVDNKNTIERNFESLSHYMAKNQLSFNYISDIELCSKSCKINNKAISMGLFKYKSIIIPEKTVLSEEVVNRLAEFSKKGIRILAIKNLSNNILKKINVEFVKLDDLKDILVPDIFKGQNSSSIRCLKGKYKQSRAYYMFNASKKTSTFKISANDTKYPAILNPETGDVNRLDSNTKDGFISISIEAYQSIFVFPDNNKKKIPLVRNYKAADRQLLNGNWKYKEEVRYNITKQGIKRLNNVRDKYIEIPNLNASKGTAKNFSGTVSFISEIVVNSKVKANKYYIDFGLADNFIELWVNGKKIGVRIWRPYIFDITDKIKSGRNTIKVLVTNTLANEMGSIKAQSLLKSQKWDNAYYHLVLKQIKKIKNISIGQPELITVKNLDI
jgi:hypothetical protein